MNVTKRLRNVQVMCHNGGTTKAARQVRQHLLFRASPDHTGGTAMFAHRRPPRIDGAL